MPRPAGMVERELEQEEVATAITRIRANAPLTLSAAVDLPNLFGRASRVKQTLERNFLSEPRLH